MAIEREWTTEAGLRAVAVMNDRMGFRCGYVEVPADHPLHGVDYNDDCAALGTVKDLENEPLGKRSPMALLSAGGKESESLVTPDLYFDVHGGITYAQNPCPMLDDGSTDSWWYGFDCGHVGDATSISRQPGDVDRTLEYVVSECESLARQIAAVNTP